MEAEHLVKASRSWPLMRTTTKALLALSLAAFAVSFTGILWGAGGTFGAVLFGLFLTSKALEKQSSRYDEEQRLTPLPTGEEKIPTSKPAAVAVPVRPNGRARIRVYEIG